MDTKILRKGFGTAAGRSAQLAAYHQACIDAANEIDRLRSLIDSAPVAIMDTRAALGICAPTEEDFPALYALQGKRVRLVADESPNVELRGPTAALSPEAPSRTKG